MVTVKAAGAAPEVAERKLCSLQYALGRIEECPLSARCPFWEEGGAVLDAGCLLERMLPPEDWTPELAARWLRVRRSLVRASGNGTKPEEGALFSLLHSGRYRE